MKIGKFEVNGMVVIMALCIIGAVLLAIFGK